MLSRSMRCIACVAAFATLVTFTACSPTLPIREPDIHGTITLVMRNGNSGSVRIEVEPGENDDDKASVTITPETKLLRAVSGASPEPITLDDVTEDMVADAWFTGPIAESYPLQATGEAVLVSK